MSIQNEDLTGRVFGRLTVTSYAYSKNYRRYWYCTCSCGNEKQIPVQTSKLKNGHTRSCGCIGREKTIERNLKHGKSRHRLNSIWRDMRRRCNDTKRRSYKSYGGRGIKVCSAWEEDFINFYNWSIENGYKEDLSLDRIDVNGNYEPSNCRWATNKEQGNNTRRNRLFTINGETKTLSEWVDIYNMDYSVVEGRINRYKWSIEEALEIEKHYKNKLYYTYNGETKTLNQWGEQYGIPYDSMYNRLIKQNWTFEEAVELKNRKGKGKTITYNGETKTMREWSVYLNIPYQTIVARINKKLPIEDVLSKERIIKKQTKK